MNFADLVAGLPAGVVSVLLVATVAVPLATAALVAFVRAPLALLPWAAVPGLAAALAAPVGTVAELPFLVIGLRLELDRVGTVFLGFGALLWMLAGLYAGSYMAAGPRLRSFAVFWLLTLSGTLGCFVAGDVVAFYFAFSVMSLAAYGLVVHERTHAARRAGRIYIVLAVLGETAMLAGLMVAGTYAASLDFAAVRAALSTGPWGGYALAALLVGLGMKAGLAPLHVWLPLAHPQAPTPASAVLSGVIVKAGIIGLIRLLPVDAGAPAWGAALILLGLATAYYGIVCGLLQKDPKAMLAYSTLSQMGLVVTVLGSAFGAADPARNVDAAVLYATHHGLAKGALFLAVGVLAFASPGRFRLIALAVTAVAAFAIAGLPFTGGAIAKLAIKEPLGAGTAASLVTVSALGTALLMIRFLLTVARPPATPGGHDSPVPGWRMIIGWAAAAGAAVAVPAYLFTDLSGHHIGYLASPKNLLAASWPIGSALVLAVAVRTLWRGPAPSIPQGDVVVLVEKLPRILVAAGSRLTVAWALMTEPSSRLARTDVFKVVDALERHLQRWSWSGPTMVLIAVLLGLSLWR